jgi:hypothetical protein
LSKVPFEHVDRLLDCLGPTGKLPLRVEVGSRSGPL